MSHIITRHAFWIILAFMTAGFLVPDISANLRPYTFIFLFCVMLFTLLRMPVALRLSTASRKQHIKLIGWQSFLSPLLVWAFTQLAHIPVDIGIALIACSCAGPVFSTPAFARLTGLDDQFTIQNVLIASFLMPITIGLAAIFLLPGDLSIELLPFAQRFAIFLLLPAALGWIFQHLTSATTKAKLTQPLMGLATLSLALMACSLMDGIFDKLLAEPEYILSILAAGLAFNLGHLLLTALIFYREETDFRLNAALVCGYRNWALTFALTAGSLGDTFTTFVALGQFGVMLMPLPSLKFLQKWIEGRQSVQASD